MDKELENKLIEVLNSNNIEEEVLLLILFNIIIKRGESNDLF